ncbi:MAG TPA: tRNA pseudouridine(55) synthase TruB [Gammaproteobacteria bacterium]|nr:tRNA pseudouridine(55) synthase TruB [Gammaproteobacteria bacterium]
MTQIKNPRRKLDGVLLLDKATGVSSNRALQQVKHLFNAAKAGHTGSLDPLASGVLPICFGEATKFSRFLLDADKTYLVTAQLGVITDSGDSEGAIIAENPVPEFADADILRCIAAFKGSGSQVPSMFSALKHNGQPLYKLARQNITVDRPARDIYVHEYELLSRTHDTVTCKIKCSKGTYIRTMVEDLGNALGCGAHVTSLRRVQAGPFGIERCYAYTDLEYIEDLPGVLLPVESLLSGLPKVVLDETDAAAIRNGKQIHITSGALGLVSAFSADNNLLGIIEVCAAYAKAVRITSARNVAQLGVG